MTRNEKIVKRMLANRRNGATLHDIRGMVSALTSCRDTETIMAAIIKAESL